MKTLKRLAYLTLGLATAHLIFGAIVRISGSGMGCGDHWPTCWGRWFPPLTQPTLVIEWTHRLLAALLITAVVSLALAVVAKRGEPGVRGEGGVLRSATLAAVVVVVTAIFGAITVWLGNVWYATLVHWLLAAALLAALAATVIRTGGLGGTSARRQRTTPRAARSAATAAGLALVVVLLGGMTAKIPGASAACQGFPLCSGQLIPSLPVQDVQMTHRVVAFLLFFHVLGLLIGFTRRGEAPVVLRAVRVAFGLIMLQLVVAASMVELHLPMELRSLHQAVGVGIWLSLFTLAYLSRIASRTPERSAVVRAPTIAAAAREASTPATPVAQASPGTQVTTAPVAQAPTSAAQTPTVMQAPAPTAPTEPPTPPAAPRPPRPAPSVAVIIARGADS